MQHPFLAAVRHLGAAFLLGGASTLLMRAVQRNATLGFRALDTWRTLPPLTGRGLPAVPAPERFDLYR